MTNVTFIFPTTAPFLLQSSLYKKCSRPKIHLSRKQHPSSILHNTQDPPFSDNPQVHSHTPSQIDTSHIILEDADIGAPPGNIGGGNSNSGSGPDNSSSGSSDDLPEHLRLALSSGLITTETLARYRSALRNPLTRLLLSIPAFRTRFLADSAFIFKLLVQELVGNGTALASEIAVRGNDIVHELEYVASDLIVGTVVEAAFVWLLAPTLPLSQPSSSPIARYFASLPSNFFQPSGVTTFSTSQRFVSFFYAGAQYALIGFVAGVFGTAITYGLIEGRKAMDPKYKPERSLPAVLPNSAAWGLFMAVSSNTRFQIVEGMEVGITKLCAGRADAAVSTAIVALRFLNNYWGGVQFVKFFRYMGLHATGESNGH